MKNRKENGWRVQWDNRKYSFIYLFLLKIHTPQIKFTHLKKYLEAESVVVSAASAH